MRVDLSLEGFQLTGFVGQFQLVFPDDKMVDSVHHFLDAPDQAADLVIFRIHDIVGQMFVQFSLLDGIRVSGQKPQGSGLFQDDKKAESQGTEDGQDQHQKALSEKPVRIPVDVGLGSGLDQIPVHGGIQNRDTEMKFFRSLLDYRVS